MKKRESLSGQIVAANLLLVVAALFAAAAASSLDLNLDDQRLQFALLAMTVVLALLLNILMLQRRFSPLDELIREIEAVDPSDPGSFTAPERPVQEVERLAHAFANLLARTRVMNARNYRVVNRQAMDQTRRFIDFKKRMQREQEAGRLKSLVWPTFFDHTAREADHFVDRLNRLNAGNTAVDRASATSFWTLIMGEHADFVAHLLDPAEEALHAKAMQTSDAFRALHRQLNTGAAIKAVDDIIDFKVAAEQGIQTGKIKSIIHPTLADHVRREALKAADELRRAA